MEDGMEKRDRLLACAEIIASSIVDPLEAAENAEDIETEKEWLAKALQYATELQKMAREAIEERDAASPPQEHA